MSERLDVTSDPNPGGSKNTEKSAERSLKNFIGIQFACCGIYSRIYKNHAGTHYAGNCPKCAKQVRFKIGSGGSDSRFFTAY